MDAKTQRRRVNPVNRKNELKKAIAECQRLFLRTIVQITKNLHAKNKRDGDLAELKEQISIAVRDAPEDIFLEAGKYLWGYREDISRGEVKKFLGMDYTKEVDKKTKDSAEAEQVQKLITKIKRTWKLLNDIEQKNIIKDVQKMLAKYVQWQGHKNQLLALKSKN